jgi:hypothetical protein
LMKWLKKLLNQDEKKPEVNEDVLLIHEIAAAKEEWTIAQKKLDYVVDFDQIDYAIFMLEAAEKRYQMLLKQAKERKISLLHK